MKIIQADLLDFPDGINAIGHSANCRNTMNSGIAKSIKERYPAAYAADTLAHKNQTNILGSYSTAFVPDPNGPSSVIIGNLYTQAFYGSSGRYVNYEGFFRALDSFVVFCKNGNNKLGLPYGISCGLAGGDWGIISSMISFIETLHSTEIVICKLKDLS